MPSSEPVNWQPMSQTPLVADLIDGALRHTRDHLHTLTKARAKPTCPRRRHCRSHRAVHREQLEFVDIYAEQIQRWRTQGPSAAQTRELDHLKEQDRHVRAVTTDVLALAQELRKGTIDRIMAMMRSRSRAAGPPRNPAAARDVARPYRPRTRLAVEPHGGHSNVSLGSRSRSRSRSAAASEGPKRPY
jgi:hypothetical protein